MANLEARAKVGALKHHVFEELNKMEEELKREELLFSITPQITHFDPLESRKNRNLISKVIFYFCYRRKSHSSD